MEESDKHKTVFSCPIVGVQSNAPKHYKRTKYVVLFNGKMHGRPASYWGFGVSWLSDCVLPNSWRAWGEALKSFDKASRIWVEKCNFFQTSVRYFGHKMSKNDVQTDPENISGLKTWPKPKNPRELKSFLGFAGYYRHFIRDYSKIVKPLTDLTAGYAPLNLKETTSTQKTHLAIDGQGEYDYAFKTIVSKLLFLALQTWPYLASFTRTQVTQVLVLHYIRNLMGRLKSSLLPAEVFRGVSLEIQLIRWSFSP